MNTQNQTNRFQASSLKTRRDGITTTGQARKEATRRGRVFSRPLLGKPLCVLLSVLIAAPILWAGAPPRDSDALDLQSWRSLAVQHEGRVKPLDTFAEAHLLAFSGKRSHADLDASSWLLELMLEPEKAFERKVFAIRNPEVVTAFDLPERKKRKYSFNEVFPATQKHIDFLQKVYAREPEQRSLVETQALDLYFQSARYGELSRSLACFAPNIKIRSHELSQQLGLAHGEATSFYRLLHQTNISELWQGLAQADMNKLTEVQQELLHLAKQWEAFNKRPDTAFNIVPQDDDGHGHPWVSPAMQLAGKGHSTEGPTLMKHLDRLVTNYLTKTPSGFAADATLLFENQQSIIQSGDNKLGLEVWYNQNNLFVKSLAFYVFAFLLLSTSWLMRSERLRKISFYVLLAGIVCHLVGVVIRTYLMGRPPVSNLYETIVFVGLIGVFTCAIWEVSRKHGLGIFVASTLGSVLHFIAFRYAADGDTMGMLVAVLDSNFWLATHVITISMGYGCALVAGIVGHLYLFFQIARPKGSERLEQLGGNMAGLALVALFFTLLGTILGGIWADQSWGRFWGWDPKENGALLIVMWLLMLQHGKIANMFGNLGYAVGLVLANITVALAWFGVNLLNVGLHSYGFAGGVALNLGLFCAFEVVYVLITYPLARRKITVLEETRSPDPRFVRTDKPLPSH